MHAKSGGSSGEPPDFLFIPAACRSRKDLPRSAGGGGRARNTGYRLRNAEDGGTGTGRRRRGCGATGTERRAAGPRVRVRDAEHVDADAGTGTGARARGHGVQDAERRTQNAERRTRATGRGQQNTGNGGTKCRRRKTRARGAGRRTRATGRGQQNTGNAGTGRRRRGTSPRAWNATRPHTPRQAPQQPAWTVHSRAPSAAGRRYLSRVRIRITPLPPRTPYMLLPRCTSTDLTS